MGVLSIPISLFQGVLFMEEVQRDDPVLTEDIRQVQSARCTMLHHANTAEEAEDSGDGRGEGGGGGR